MRYWLIWKDLWHPSFLKIASQWVHFKGFQNAFRHLRGLFRTLSNIWVEAFCKNRKPLTTFAARSWLNAWQGSEYAYAPPPKIRWKPYSAGGLDLKQLKFSWNVVSLVLMYLWKPRFHTRFYFNPIWPGWRGGTNHPRSCKKCH